MAVSLGISRIIIHKYSSILSAYGMALADIAQELQEPCSLEYGAANHSQLTTHIKALSTKAVAELERQGLKAGEIRTEVILNMRYRGSESQLMTPIPEGSTDFGQIFAAIHAREYGFTSDRPVLVDDIRVRASGSRHRAHERSPFVDFESLEKRTVAADQAAETRKAYFGNGWRPTPVFQLDELQPGNVIQGPAIIIDNTQTLVVIPNATATVLHRHVVVDLSASDKVAIRSDQVDPIQLAVFGNRFMAIAEDMGRTLQKVAVSTNVKERLDFSCAIFDADGGLTANAPHVPVHLGSMSR
jgi:5-oxoprolinase (ATP-hydrolysing)